MSDTGRNFDGRPRHAAARPPSRNRGAGSARPAGTSRAACWATPGADLRRKPLFVDLGDVHRVLPGHGGLPRRCSPRSTRRHGDLERSRNGPSADAWFGYDVQGRDVYARVIYGARASIWSSVLATIGTMLFGGAHRHPRRLPRRAGSTACCRGSPTSSSGCRSCSARSSSCSRSTPGRAAACSRSMLVVLRRWWCWSGRCRCGSCGRRCSRPSSGLHHGGPGDRAPAPADHLPAPDAEHPRPAAGLRHDPLGSYIGAEATLSFLGIGLRSPVVSWGIMISRVAATTSGSSPHLLFFPAGFLVVAVLELRHARRGGPRGPRPEASLGDARDESHRVRAQTVDHGQRSGGCSRSRTCGWSSAPGTA